MHSLLDPLPECTYNLLSTLIVYVGYRKLVVSFATTTVFWELITEEIRRPTKSLSQMTMIL